MAREANDARHAALKDLVRTFTEAIVAVPADGQARRLANLMGMVLHSFWLV